MLLTCFRQLLKAPTAHFIFSQLLSKLQMKLENSQSFKQVLLLLQKLPLWVLFDHFFNLFFHYRKLQRKVVFSSQNFDDFAESQTIFEDEKQRSKELLSFLQLQDITVFTSFVKNLDLMFLLLEVVKIVLNGIGVELNTLLKSTAMNLVEKRSEKHAINTKLLTMYSQLNPLQNSLVLSLSVKNPLYLHGVRLPVHILTIFDNVGDGFGGELVDQRLDFEGLADSFLVVVVLLQTFGIDFCELLDFVQNSQLLLDGWLPFVDVHLDQDVPQVQVKVEIALVTS